MNPLEQYKNTRTVIHCPTFIEAERIGKLIEEMGGESLAKNWNIYKGEFCLNLERIPKCTYGYKKWFLENKFVSIPASEILNKEPEILNNYQIF